MDSQQTAAMPIAVVGATGQQGSAVVTALLAAGVPVRALVRDPAAEAAQRLQHSGVELARADLDQPDTLTAAFTGVTSVFAMTTFAGPDKTEGEVVNGRAIGDAALAAGVTHVVYSSVGGAERHTGIPHFESKRRVEEYLRTLGLRSTFVRPAFFMDNFASLSRPSEDDGTLVVRLPLPPGVALQMVATRDIGRVATAVLLEPDVVPDGSVEIAGDELTGEQVAEAFGRARGVPARFEAQPLDVLPDDDQKAMFAWFAQSPAYQADRELTRRLDPDVWDLSQWLTQQ